jgi:hypothetical protein
MYIMIKGITLLLKIFVKNIVARSFVNLNRCNQLVIRQKHVSYCLILNENTQRIPFVDRNIFKGNRTQKEKLNEKAMAVLPRFLYFK